MGRPDLGTSRPGDLGTWDQGTWDLGAGDLGTWDLATRSVDILQLDSST